VAWSDFYQSSQILAAHRYGIKRVIIPERNLKDLAEVPPSVLANLEVTLL
jgi:ATP-dependent Lon protease